MSAPSAPALKKAREVWNAHKYSSNPQTMIDGFARALDAATRATWEAAAEEIPISWLDPLLSGPERVLPGFGPWPCPDIERLLRAIKSRLRARAAEATP